MTLKDGCYKAASSTYGNGRGRADHSTTDSGRPLQQHLLGRLSIFVLTMVLPPEQVSCGSNPITARAHPRPHMRLPKSQRPRCDSCARTSEKMCFPQVLQIRGRLSSIAQTWKQGQDTSISAVEFAPCRAGKFLGEFKCRLYSPKAFHFKSKFLNCCSV